MYQINSEYHAVAQCWQSNCRWDRVDGWGMIQRGQGLQKPSHIPLTWTSW